jgi:hypothetical protein
VAAGVRGRAAAAALAVRACLALFAAGCGEAVGIVAGSRDAGQLDAAPDTGSGEDPAPDGGLCCPSSQDGGQEERVRLFVAQGHAGRTLVSCDDGHTWRADRSDAPDARCGTRPTDCDHTPSAARGIAFGNGWFVATFGWGLPGSIRRSRDGVTWERVAEGSTYGSMVYGNGRFLAASSAPMVSTDDGATWGRGGTPDLATWTVRRAGFGGTGGVFVLFAEDGSTRDWAISTNHGATWARPQAIPAACGVDQWAGGIVSGNGVLVAMNGSTACRSLDDGRTWTQGSVGGTVLSRLVWTGSEFMAWGRRSSTDQPSLFRSADGATWTTVATQTRRRSPDGSVTLGEGPPLEAVAHGGDTFVGVNGGWDVWYEKQLFYRSTDGVTWDVLPAGASTGGHPIQHIAFGEGRRSPTCP